MLLRFLVGLWATLSLCTACISTSTGSGEPVQTSPEEWPSGSIHVLSGFEPLASFRLNGEEFSPRTSIAWRPSVFPTWGPLLLHKDFLLESVHSLETLQVHAPGGVLAFEQSTLPGAAASLKILEPGTGALREMAVDAGNLPLPEEEGLYLYLLTLRFDPETHPYYSSATYAFELLVDFPMSLDLPLQACQPGDLLPLRVAGGRNLLNLDSGTLPTLTVESGPFAGPLPLLSLEDGHVGFLPLDYDAVPGTYALDIRVVSGNESLDLEWTLEILPKDFPVQQLNIDPAALSLREEESAAEDRLALAEAFARTSPEALWTGPFLQPVSGRISTEYGMRRSVNDNVTAYRHRGIDIAAPQGTPILASNGGTVVLARPLNITGETVILDHGMGIHTLYAHLHAVHVQPGEVVAKGQLLGEVGSTGFSTGPHLHFETTYRGEPMNPWNFFRQDPLLP
ncbi:M23 family metallopeptidase [Anaerotalea alkaliphila]|uniref:M23 family metallopeptidase n=1 Tax=Anaerotalea alkaliphila TaxID=2662126 RepID=A0A7X5HWK4_9FIRM|nr:M23 family metallopeptidase [Anaerotalea alkaliphila]NDL67995.1 M23 family metallopeptidase [Anaerotalea alkaliphila]